MNKQYTNILNRLKREINSLRLSQVLEEQGLDFHIEHMDEDYCALKKGDFEACIFGLFEDYQITISDGECSQIICGIKDISKCAERIEEEYKRHTKETT